MKTYSQAEQTALMQAIASAFIALRDGSNDEGDYDILAGIVNIGLVRSESLDDATEEVFRAAQQALLRAGQIHDSLKAFVFTQSDLVDLAKAVQGYSELLKTSSEAQMKAAIAEADRRLAAGMHARLGSIH